MISWIYLVLAGLIEITWPPLLKASNGFRNPGLTFLMLALMALSFWLLSLSLRTIPIGTGYAVWTGIGAVGAAMVGIIYYGEPRTAGRLLCIALIVAGIVGLKLLTPSSDESN